MMTSMLRLYQWKGRAVALWEHGGSTQISMGDSIEAAIERVFRKVHPEAQIRVKPGILPDVTHWPEWQGDPDDGGEGSALSSA
jgi:hypothetical protein